MLTNNIDRDFQSIEFFKCFFSFFFSFFFPAYITWQLIYMSFVDIYNFETKLELCWLPYSWYFHLWFICCRFYLFGCFDITAWLVPVPNSPRFLTQPEMKCHIFRWLKYRAKTTFFGLLRCRWWFRCFWELNRPE